MNGPGPLEIRMVPEVLGLIKTLEWFEPVSEWSSLVDTSQRKPLQTPAGCLSLQIHYSAGHSPRPRQQS